MALLEIRDVTVRFGGITAVDGATLSADEGTITGLIGPNGAGKTTLFNVVTGLQPPTGGQVRFAGTDVTRAGVSTRARMGMARTFQRLEAFGSLTVRENVQVACEIHGGPRTWLRPHRPHRAHRRVDELIATVGLGRYAEHRADSVPTGVARLLEIARALAIEPRLLLLDEPSSGLDEGETDAFGDLLRRLAAEGRAVLMVEHDMDLVMGVCETIHVLEFGRVIASGTPAQIRADRTVQAAYLGFSDDRNDAGNDAGPAHHAAAGADTEAPSGGHVGDPLADTRVLPAVGAER